MYSSCFFSFFGKHWLPSVIAAFAQPGHHPQVTMERPE